MKHMKGHASLQAVIGTAIAIVGMLGGFFAWSLNAVRTNDAHAAQTDTAVSLIDTHEQADKLSILNQQNKIEWLVTATQKIAQRLQVTLDNVPINQ